MLAHFFHSVHCPIEIEHELFNISRRSSTPCPQILSKSPTGPNVPSALKYLHSSLNKDDWTRWFQKASGYYQTSWTTATKVRKVWSCLLNATISAIRYTKKTQSPSGYINGWTWIQSGHNDVTISHESDTHNVLSDKGHTLALIIWNKDFFIIYVYKHHMWCFCHVINVVYLNFICVTVLQAPYKKLQIFGLTSCDWWKVKCL